MSDAPENRLHRTVVVGSGFGGLFAARALRKAPVEVTLISKTTHHTFQPLLYQVGTGILSQGEIAPATREILKRQERTQVLLGEVVDVDPGAKTVTSEVRGMTTVTEYDTLIVAAGARTSYFGNDDFEMFAPGLKSIDDALEVRGRIFGAFELAELQSDPEEAAPWLTFAVVGAGPTGVEVAGQIVELAQRAIRDDFRRIDPRDVRVVLIDGGDAVLKSFGPRQSAHAHKQLEKMGIDIKLNAMVRGVDTDTVTIEYPDGHTEVLAAKCKVWAAGVEATPLTSVLRDRTGVSLDRAGRVQVQPDLTIPGHPDIFVIGDMAALDDLPGVAQVAMQGGKYAANQIRRQASGDPRDPAPFKYFDKGSMATISRFRAVANAGPFQLRGFIAWLAWLFIHIMYLVGFHQRLSTLGHWFIAFIGRSRTERTVTTYQALGSQLLISDAERQQTHLHTLSDGHYSPQSTVGDGR